MAHSLLSVDLLIWYGYTLILIDFFKKMNILICEQLWRSHDSKSTGNPLLNYVSVIPIIDLINQLRVLLTRKLEHFDDNVDPSNVPCQDRPRSRGIINAFCAVPNAKRWKRWHPGLGRILWKASDKWSSSITNSTLLGKSISGITPA